jgi:formate dehydrogenase subunit beta
LEKGTTSYENQIVDALLVPLEIGQGRSLVQTLVQDPAYLNEANPFSPVMPVNSATLVSQLTGDKPSQKVGVVLRSCEIRALIDWSPLWWPSRMTR